MSHLNKTASLTIEALWLATENEQCVDLDRPGYMHLHAERLPDDQIAVSHTFEQNGDLMRDPEIVFYRQSEGIFFCVECTQDATGSYTKCVVMNGQRIEGTYPYALRSVTELANILGKNIPQQFPIVREMVKELKKKIVAIEK